MTLGERRALALVGLLALGGLSVSLWQQGRGQPLRLTRAVDPPQAAAWDLAVRQARQVDVNTAGVAELERLPRVGPSLARRIIAYRQAHGPFRNPEELLRVEGIGPQTLAALEDHVSVNE